MILPIIGVLQFNDRPKLTFTSTPGTYNYGSDFYFDIGGLNINYGATPNITMTLANTANAAGDYVDMTFSGTYTEISGNVRSIVGVAHIIRDN